MAVKEFWG